jgi:hypothetical protein
MALIITKCPSMIEFSGTNNPMKSLLIFKSWNHKEHLKAFLQGTLTEGKDQYTVDLLIKIALFCKEKKSNCMQLILTS